MGTGLRRRVRYFRRMSVAEIKEELHRLSRDERREIARLLVELDAPVKTEPHIAGDFAEAKAYVFDNYGDLLQRLAQ